MSKLSDRISYLQGLAEGMKLNVEKDSNRLIVDILDVLGDVSEAIDALGDAHQELSEYVESIDEDLADLESELYDDDDEDAYVDDEDDDEYDDDEADDEDDEVITYECPHCGQQVEIDAADVDFDAEAKCPGCGKELFPELPAEE